MCEATSPNWTPAFALIAGCVCDGGGSLTHAAIVSREYGIPCVVGCSVAHRRASAPATWSRSTAPEGTVSDPRRAADVSQLDGKRVVVTGAARGIGARAGRRAAAARRQRAHAPTFAGRRRSLRRERRRRGRRPVRETRAPVDGLVDDAALLVGRKAPRRDRPRRVGPHVRGERARDVPVRAGGGRGHGRARRQHRERGVGDGGHRVARLRALRGVEGRGAVHDDGARQRARAAGHPGQLRGAGLHTHARLRGARRLRPDPHAARPRDAPRPTCSARSATCSPTTRPSCRARRSWSTAAGSRPDGGGAESARRARRHAALAELVRRREVHPHRELVEAAIERLDAVDPALNAVIHRQFERAMADAERAPARRPVPRGAVPAEGLPRAPKPASRTTKGCGRCEDAGWRARADSPLALRFRIAGLIPLGRTNMPELAMMGTTEPDAYGPTHNPWALGRSPGGSSGGSAAAVAARHRAGRPRQRHRRVDPHPRRAVRAGRAAARRAAVSWLARPTTRPSACTPRA